MTQSLGTWSVKSDRHERFSALPVTSPVLQIRLKEGHSLYPVASSPFSGPDPSLFLAQHVFLVAVS